jgi:hypothetical protein
VPLVLLDLWLFKGNLQHLLCELFPTFLLLLLQSDSGSLHSTFFQHAWVYHFSTPTPILEKSGKLLEACPRLASLPAVMLCGTAFILTDGYMLPHAAEDTSLFNFAVLLVCELLVETWYRL